MRKNLLFVTKGVEDCSEGITYALDLAKSLGAGIEMLVVFSQPLQRYEDVMAAVAFAEAGQLETVRELMDGERQALDEAVKGKVERVAAMCRRWGVEFSSRVEAGNMVSLIEGSIEREGIDMVLLSPEVTTNWFVRKLKGLLRRVSKPVVAISRPARAGI